MHFNFLDNNMDNVSYALGLGIGRQLLQMGEKPEEDTTAAEQKEGE